MLLYPTSSCVTNTCLEKTIKRLVSKYNFPQYASSLQSFVVYEPFELETSLFLFPEFGQCLLEDM